MIRTVLRNPAPLIVATLLAACTPTGQSCEGTVESCEGKQPGMACQTEGQRTGKCMPSEEAGGLVCLPDESGASGGA